MASMVLRGDEMMADPNYKQRLKEFSQVVNPKPSEEERQKMKEAYLAKHHGVMK